MLNMPFLYQSAKVYTAAGALVASAYGESTVDVSSLSKGVYIIRIHTYEGEVVSKIVKN